MENNYDNWLGLEDFAEQVGLSKRSGAQAKNRLLKIQPDMIVKTVIIDRTNRKRKLWRINPEAVPIYLRHVNVTKERLFNDQSELCCVRCLKFKDKNLFPQISGKRKRRKTCSSCYTEPTRIIKQNILRLKVLSLLGNKCECCGETELGFLTLDHVKNDGSKHRSRIGNNVNKFWQSIIDEGLPKDRYRVLCINCNWARSRYGICPHQGKIDYTQTINHREGAE